MTTGALITGLVIGGQSGRHAPPAAIGAAHPGLSVAKASVPQSPVTSAAIVYRLKQILPPGKTSDYGQADDVPAWGQIVLDRGHGPAVLLLHVGKSVPDTARDSSPELRLTLLNALGSCRRGTGRSSCRDTGRT
jgi:hypothetical protein